MSAVDQFFVDYNNKSGVSFDGLPDDVDQCVQQVAFYVRDYLHYPVYYANARFWFDNFENSPLRPNFYKITNVPNDPTVIPPRGAIIIWGGNSPGSGGNGHIAVVASSNANTFTSMDDNWGGKYCHYVIHNYGYVEGWLVPINSGTPVEAPITTPQGGIEIMDTEAKVQSAYFLLRGRAATAPEVTGWLNKSYQSFLESPLTIQEVNNRNTAKAQEDAQLVAIQETINKQNVTIATVTQNADATTQQLKEALLEVAKDNADLATAHDTITDLQKQLPVAAVSKQNILVSLLNGLLKALKLKKG